MIQCSFARAIRRQERTADLRRAGADVQDLAATFGYWMGLLRLHPLCGALGSQQCAIQVDSEHVLPGVEWKVEQWRDVKDAGVVDQDVQSTELVSRAGEKLI